MKEHRFSEPFQNNFEVFQVPIWPFFVILLGFSFRLYSFYFTPVVNQDAVIYINQAKAVYYGQYRDLTLCYPYVSIYPITIALCYKFIGDWIVSGATVSILFSTLMLIPLYLLLRRFFDRNISTLALLVFSVCPTFVGLSHMIIRGPIYWFFATLGIYLFILGLDKIEAKYLLLSCTSFALASSARGEALFLMGGSAAFLLFTKGRRKWKYLFSFSLPILSILLFVAILAWVKGGQVFGSSPLEHIVSKSKSVLNGYESLLNALRNIDKFGPPNGFSPYFFPAVQRMILLIASGELFRVMMKAFFPPFFVLLFLGFPGIRKRMKHNPNLIYLCLLSGISLLVLFAQTISNWAITTRHVFLFLLPSFVIVGFGIVRLAEFLSNRLRRKQIFIYLTLFLAIFLAPLYNNLKANGIDKLPFKQIGEFIALKQGNQKRIRVGGAFKWVSLIDLYANLNFPGVICSSNNSIQRNEAKATIQKFLERHFDYYVWDERYNTQETLQAIMEKCPYTFENLGQWPSCKVGKMVLFKIRE